jgi:quinol monooxygenase YgiN
VIRRVAEYTIREGELEPVLDAIVRFVAAVRAAEPGTRYEAYRRADTLSFLHTMAFPDADAEDAHRRAAYTTAFVQALYPRCVEPPRFTELRAVGGAGE